MTLVEMKFGQNEECHPTLEHPSLNASSLSARQQESPTECPGAGVAQSVQSLGYRLDDRVSLTGSPDHPASCPMDTEGSYPGGKATGAWSWPRTSI
jgi:hypothetical protein